MKLFELNDNEIKHSDNTNFMLHSHNEYEIYMFLGGDSKYIVEDKVYALSKGDIIIINGNEMHRVFHNRPAAYHSFVISLSPDFFEVHGCKEYEEAFLHSNSSSKGHKISATDVKTSGLYDAIMRIRKYSDKCKNISSPVISAVIIEILYIVNKLVTFSDADVSENPLIKEVISYINENFTGEITLDNLAEEFFVSKYHLCRIFKESTGHTIQGYIKNKRLIKTKELLSEGKNLTDAALLSGFNSYSSFYRARHGDK